MKIRIEALFLLFMFFAFNVSAQEKKQEQHEPNFSYTGSNWAKYEGHLMTMVVLDTSVSGIHLLAEQHIKDGKFNVTGYIEYPQNAFFGLYNSDGDFVYKQEFVIEPGKLVIDRDEKTNGINVIGGKYNPIFIGLEKDEKYVALKQNLADFEEKAYSGEIKYDNTSEKLYDSLKRAVSRYRSNAYNEIRFNNPDPYARLLAIYHSDRSRFDEQLSELESEIGMVPEIVYLRYSAKAARERSQNNQTVKLGTVIKDFDSETIDGQPFHLATSLKENKYTLVEFWASWCGPCRAEIPHMKTAYERFHDKGFEIVSFTLDHERNRWEKASNDENLPWINVGDLLAFKSPVTKMFGIGAIPANYLVDNTGTIIAKDLRQDNLDSKLEELLGK